MKRKKDIFRAAAAAIDAAAYSISCFDREDAIFQYGGLARYKATLIADMKTKEGRAKHLSYFFEQYTFNDCPDIDADIIYALQAIFEIEKEVLKNEI